MSIRRLFLSSELAHVLPAALLVPLQTTFPQPLALILEVVALLFLHSHHLVLELELENPTHAPQLE